jgi:uncharacterized protein YxeA
MEEINMKKIIISIVFIVTLIGAGVQAYASQVLDTNIVALIQTKLNTVVNNDQEEIDQFI